MRVGAGGFHSDIRPHVANAKNDLTPAMRGLLEELLNDLACTEGRIKAVNAKVEAYASQHGSVSRLVTIPGLAALGATALVAAACDGRQFRKPRNLAAWLRLVPAEHSTGGKQTLLGISEHGNRYVRRLIFHGTRSCLLHLNRANHALGGWLSALETRTRRNKAVVALANKLTRIVWAILTRPGTAYLQLKGAALG